MKTLHVWPESPEYCDGEVRLRAIFDGFDSGAKTIEIAAQQSALLHIPSRSDHFAFGALFPAMRSCDTCAIHGEVSRSLLTNLAELNAFWHFWRPQIYRRVHWEPDKVAEKSLSSEQRSGHLFAYSGGVDSSATLRRHTSESLGWRNVRVGAALIGAEAVIFSRDAHPEQFLSKVRFLALEIHDENEAREQVFDALRECEFEMSFHSETVFGVNRKFR